MKRKGNGVECVEYVECMIARVDGLVGCYSPAAHCSLLNQGKKGRRGKSTRGKGGDGLGKTG